MNYLPTKIGAVRTFSAYGRVFEVKRLDRRTWHLRAADIKSRSRFGARAEILQDVAAALETGALPGGNKGRW